MRIRISWVLALAPLVPLHAQRPVTPTAEAVARTFLSELNAERWSAAATHLDLDALQLLVSRTIEMARGYRAPQSLTLEDILRQAPDMPREAAAWQLRMIQEYGARDPGPIAGEFAGITSADSLAALSLPRAAAAWLEAQDERSWLRASLARERCPEPSSDSLAQVLRRTVLGVVEEGDSVAFVLHRSARVRVAANGPQPPFILELRRRDGAWRVQPRSFERYGPDEGISAELTCQRALPPARRVRP